MAPRKRSGRGISFIFCCFRSSDHPEITYRLRNDSSFALQTMEPSLPMPPVEELDAMFTELVVSRILLHFSSTFGVSPSVPSTPSLQSPQPWFSVFREFWLLLLNPERCSSLKSCQFGVVSLIRNS